MESMKDMLAKAFQIGNDAKFLVRITDCGVSTDQEMTYLQLGLFLTKSVNLIKRVEIILRD